MCDFDSGYNGDSDFGGEGVTDTTLDSTIETLDADVDTVQDVSETDVEMLELNSDISDLADDDETVGKSFFDDFGLDELDDGNYHATRLSEDEVQRIDDLWENDNKSVDVEPYYAERMTEEEVSQIDELNKDITLDVEPYHATPNDLDTLSNEDADRFAAEIEALSLDELEVEQNRLDKLHNDAEMDIFGEYDADVKGSLTEEQYHDLVDGLPKETLEHLRSGLENRDKDVLDYFGLGSDEGSDNTEDLTLKRSR